MSLALGLTGRWEEDSTVSGNQIDPSKDWGTVWLYHHVLVNLQIGPAVNFFLQYVR